MNSGKTEVGGGEKHLYKYQDKSEDEDAVGCR